MARLAGVSPATVSDVLNNGPRPVAPATGERVLAAIAQLGYPPNGVARGLRRQRTQVLGLIVPDNTNSHFARLAAAVEDAGFTAGYRLLFGNSQRNPEREFIHAQVLCEHRVDGVIIVPTSSDLSAVRYLVERHLPVVVVDRECDFPGADVVLVDGEYGGRLATEHLLRLGHRRIGCIAGPAEGQTSQRRVRGYQAALAAAGLPLDPALLCHGDYTYESGARWAEPLLTLAEPPTALFCANDRMAIGALLAARRRGRRLPAELAVVGFDDSPEATVVDPPLTTVAQPLGAVAAQAVAFILSRLSGQAGPEPRRVVLTPALVVRASCGAVTVPPAG